jgi:hypothetical protein
MYNLIHQALCIIFTRCMLAPCMHDGHSIHFVWCAMLCSRLVRRCVALTSYRRVIVSAKCGASILINTVVEVCKHSVWLRSIKGRLLRESTRHVQVADRPTVANLNKNSVRTGFSARPRGFVACWCGRRASAPFTTRTVKNASQPQREFIASN